MLSLDQDVPELVHQLEQDTPPEVVMKTVQQKNRPDVLVVHDLLQMVLPSEVLAKLSKPRQVLGITCSRNLVLKKS